jgi:hypothetical protein
LKEVVKRTNLLVELVRKEVVRRTNLLVELVCRRW